MHARLTIQSAGGLTVHELVPDRPVTLGRSRENAIVLADEHASRVHARIEFADGRWTVTDLDSRNGTGVDGEPIAAPTPLGDGAEIGVGDTVLRFQADGGD